MALLSVCFVITWPKCCDSFKKPDSSECKQMWIHKRKHSLPCPVLPWQEPAEDIYRASPWSWTLIWVRPTYWKKKKVSQNVWFNFWTVVLWLKCRKGGEGGHRRSYVTRRSLALFRAHLFSASKMCQCHDSERGDLLLRKKDMVRLGWWDMPQECCPTEWKNITTGFCVALTADHKQFFLSGCPNLLTQGVQWIQMWVMRQLPCGPGSPGEDSCHSRCPLRKPIAWSQRLTDCRTDCWIIKSVLPATSWLKPAQQSRLMKHDQSSSALQDTEWVSARNADKSSPIHLESWQRHTFCSSKNHAGWNIPMSLSKKRSWLVSPDQQIILFHFWPVSHSSGPATLGGVYSNTGFNPLQSIFGLPEESWLSQRWQL